MDLKINEFEVMASGSITLLNGESFTLILDKEQNYPHKIIWSFKDDGRSEHIQYGIVDDNGILDDSTEHLNCYNYNETMKISCGLQSLLGVRKNKAFFINFAVDIFAGNVSLTRVVNYTLYRGFPSK